MIAPISSEPAVAKTDEGTLVVTNSAWLLLSQGVAAVVGGLVTIYAVRHFTPVSWGHYSTALALVAVFTIFSGPGVTPLALRELTSSPERQGDVLGMAFTALAWTFCAAVVALVAATAGIGYAHEVLVLVLVLSPLLALDPLIGNIAAAFNARSRLVYVAVIQLARALVYGGLAVALIALSQGVVGLAAATLASAACAAALGLALLRSRLHVDLRTLGRGRAAWSFLRAAIPFAGVGIVGIVYDRVDTLMLSVLSNAGDVAHYSAPYGFVRLTWILPSVVSAAFFPLLSRRIDAQGAGAAPVFFLIVRIFLLLSVPLALVLCLASPTLLPLVFGDAYTPSVPVLQIMAWTCVCAFGNYVFWYGVLAAHQERPALAVQIAGLVVNVCVNAVAIPLYGPSGAAAALVVSELVVVVGQAVLVHRHLFRIRLGPLLTKPAAVAAAAIPVGVLCAHWSAVGGAVVGASAYAGGLIALGYVTSEEWRPLTSLARSLLVRVHVVGGRP